MTSRILPLNVVLLGLTCLLATPLPHVSAGPQTAGDEEAAQATEDILYLNDGRVFHGTIESEEGGQVVFSYTDRASGISTTLTFPQSSISSIERDVPIEGAAPASTRRPTLEPAEEREERTYGVRRGDVENEDLPLIYVVPMSGQMGTDVNVEVYREMLDDIRLHQPDLLVIKLECHDTKDQLFDDSRPEEQGYSDIDMLDMYRKLLNLFQDELRDVPQAVWVQDSVGVSSVLTLSWKDVFMVPEARFGGISHTAGFFMVQDPEVRAKFREAYMALLKGFVEYGGQSLQLIDAMVLPDFSLSASWKGREVNWTLNQEGEYVVDGSDKRTANFTAKMAEDFGISDGTAETMDDLVMLMGMREFRVADGEADRIFEDYKEDWRRAYEACRQSFLDYQKFLGWANGEETLMYLGRAKSELERVLAAMERYTAVELRLLREFGLNKLQIIVLIEQLKEQIRAARQAGEAGGGRGGGGRGIGGGGRGERG